MDGAPFQYVCPDCGGNSIFTNALVSVNDPTNMQMYGDQFCTDCMDGVVSELRPINDQALMAADDSNSSD